MQANYDDNGLVSITNAESMVQCLRLLGVKPGTEWHTRASIGYPMCTHISQCTISIQKPTYVPMVPVYNGCGERIGYYGKCSICDRVYVSHCY